MIIRDLLQRDLSQRIKDVIQVTQIDDAVVHDELSEYIATDSIRRQYRRLFEAIADSRFEGHQNIGVWISGFFGSGKSSFAKNIGYVLENKNLLGTPASQLFLDRINDDRIRQLVNVINSQLPVHVVMFDVSASNTIRTPDESIARIMYRQLLGALDYAPDFEIAELEIDLEAEGKLQEFERLCEEQGYGEWRKVRKGMKRYDRASALLSVMEPQTYPEVDTWAKNSVSRQNDLTVTEFVRRTFDLIERRHPGKMLVFIIDEVGRYVAHSTEKIEILRAVVEQFGQEGLRRWQSKQIVAPAWLIITSQEKLNEVVDALDQTRTELAKLQDRFSLPIDLAPEDIREVATKRVLAKTPEAEDVLSKLYKQHGGQLNAACQFEKSGRETRINEDQFIQFYPYLPHFVDMSIDIMSGIRLQPGAPRHMGGSNRTIIKQVYEMLIHDSTKLADDPVGTLVTLDKIYELVVGSLSDERRKDMDRIRQEFSEADPFILRVSKAVALLEFVPNISRSARNIAAALVDKVGEPAPIDQVEHALESLESSGLVRETEYGWKLQTAQERSWQTERREFSPRTKDIVDLLRDGIQSLFRDTRLLTIPYKGRNFRIGITVDDARVGEDGQVTLVLYSSLKESEFATRIDEIVDLSRKNENTPYWVFAVSADIHSTIREIYASNEMITRYSQLSAQNKISNDQANSLSNEQKTVQIYRTRLQDQLSQALARGNSVFNGVKRDAVVYGKVLADILRTYLQDVVPKMYPKLEMGYRPLRGNEAEVLLKAANLKALPDVFKDTSSGLGLVVQEGADYRIDVETPIAQEIMRYLKYYDEYGENERLTGKSIETNFTGIGYGWELDMLRLVLSVLFRAGIIDVYHSGRPYKSYKDEQSWKPFTNTPAFRKARFTPKKVIDRSTRIKAAELTEQIIGRQVDFQPTDIDEALKEFASTELDDLRVIIATANTHRMPFIEQLRDYQEMLQGVRENDPEQNVEWAVTEGSALLQLKDLMPGIRKATKQDYINALEYIRTVRERMWSALQDYIQSDEIEATVDQIDTILPLSDYYEQMDNLIAAADTIADVYQERYINLHRERATVFASAIEDITSQPAWEELPETEQARLLRDLKPKATTNVTLNARDGELYDQSTRASLREMESDIRAVNQMRLDAIARLQQMTAPEQVVERVRLSDFFSSTVENEEDIEQAIETMKEYLLRLVAKGVKVIVE